MPSKDHSRQVTEPEFRQALFARLDALAIRPGCVTGPGRSGAVASVYASHYLRVPWVPCGRRMPADLYPVLVVDTASQTGATLRRAMRQMQTDLGIAVFSEPPRVRFWYEALLND